MIKYEITNKFGLAPEVYQAITRKHYQGHVEGAFSSGSKIADPNFKWALTKQINEAPETFLIEYDAIDKFRTWAGTAFHFLFHHENKKNPDVIAEQTMLLDVGSEFLSGTPDYYHKTEHILKDYKSCPVYKWMKQDFKDWEIQLNCYAQMLRVKGFKVERIVAQAIIYDWLPMDARHKTQYPQNPLPEVELPIWSESQVYDFLGGKIEDKKNFYAQLSFNMVEEGCTPEERWADPTVFKVYRNDNKTAMNGGANFTTREKANSFKSVQMIKAMEKTKTAKDTFRIAEKKGNAWKRCSNWCGVSSFCKFYQGHLATEKDITAEAATV